MWLRFGGFQEKHGGFGFWLWLGEQSSGDLPKLQFFSVE